jgi:hypothetical protein
MPNRVSVKTEDLVGIIDAHAKNIGGRTNTLIGIWREYAEVNSFTEFRALEESFSATAQILQDCIDILKDWEVK